MTNVYISLDAILAFIVLGAGMAVLFMGLLSTWEVVRHKEPAAIVPAVVFGVPGILLLLAGWRVLVLS